MSRKQPRFRLDVANAFDAPGRIEATRISVEDIFRHGTWEEIREEWDSIAAELEAGIPLGEVERNYLAQALRQMCAKGKADAAFGVTRRKGLGPQYVKSIMYLVTSLQEHGASSEVAWDKVARMHWERGIYGPPPSNGSSPGEALRKQIQRAHKRMFGDM